MRKLILFTVVSTIISAGLVLTRRSEAAVTTVIAPAGTSLSTQNGPLWKYPNSATTCSRSFNEPYAFYTFDTTAGGDYTFTMNTSGFAGVIYVYRQLFVSTAPCTNIANNQNSSHNYISGSTLTLTLSASSRYVVVFSPANNFNSQNNSHSSSNVNGTFSASVTGPAAVSLVSNVTTTIAAANTPLNFQNNYTWKYPLKTDCSSLSGVVPFVAYKIIVPSTGLYTFTMNASGFAGVIHVYDSFSPNNNPCSSLENPGDDLGNVITGNSVTVPINVFGSPVSLTVVFSAQNPGAAGTFSASVTGPSQVTVLPPGDLTIASQPTSKSVTSGCQQTLSVYATGPMPQTFQWYEGVAGDLSSSVFIQGANSYTYVTPPLTSDRSYWVRVTSGADHVDSATIAFKVYQTNKTFFSGSLDPNQTWNLMTNFCQPSGTFVHYSATQIRIPADGDYSVHINQNSNFTGGYAIHLYTGFDATVPCLNFYDLSVNSDLNTHLGAGTYTVVISATNPAETSGDYEGSISTIDDCSLPETLEQALLISGNPLDKAISPGGSATLTLAYSGGSAKLKTIQWYKGFSGDTSQPIGIATGTNYTTPALNQSPPNQPTYYYYWARVTDSGQATYADTRTAIVNVLNPPVTYTDVLTQCDDVYPQVNGPTTFYKIFPFTVSTDGAYTFNVSASGFTPAVRLYQGFFSPTFPNINYYGPGATQNIIAGPNIYYLVITTTAANQTGSFTLTINGPDLVVPTPRPIITSQPADKTILRNQTATLNVTSSTPDVSYQWYTGVCTNKTPVNGANSASYTTPAMTDYQDYWVKVSYGVMYVNSIVAHVKIKPEAINDSYTTDEDTQLDVAAALGVLANDKKADSKTITANASSTTSFGVRALAANGALTYSPSSNRNGLDSFKYTVTDGILTSDEGTITINVREINDPPVRTGGSVNDHTFTEDSAGGILHLGGVSYGPGGGTDEATQTLTYKVTTVPPASVGQVTLANDTTVVTANLTTYTLSDIQGMKFKPAANGYGGPYPFTFAVTDNGNSHGIADPQTLSQSLNITVNGVADTPPTTNATTNEDTQTTSGLVLSRNAGDGAEVTHFQISQIKNGTLYKNDGVTQIDKGEFITYGEGHAGLKFKPNANLYSPGAVFSFDFQASLSNSGQGLGGTPVAATITVNPFADLPTVTGAATFANLQTNSGLVITRNQVDGSEIGFYKISSITNGTLFKSDGTTQISAGQFITDAEGLAGLRFTPAQDSSTSGTFQVQGSVDSSGAGLGPAATANISVSKYDTLTTITSASPAPSYLGQQITVSYGVQNTSGTPVPDGDVVVTVSGGSETCTATVAAGSCTLTLYTGGNPRTVTATYVGNNQFDGSTGTKDHVVNACTQNAVVTSTEDDGTSGTLRYLVTNACEGSTITFDPTVFDPANGPYVISLGSVSTFSKELSIDKNLSIRGPGANVLTVQRSTDSHVPRFRIFNIATDAKVTISGLTIRNGFATGAAFNDNLVGKGGGILNGGNLTLKTCSVSGNKAGVQPETSGLGAGVYSSGPLTVLNSTISGNDAVTGGGAIYVQAGTTASLINVTVSGNTTPGNGGGIDLSPTTHLTLINSTITNNSATTSGGGIYVDAGILIMGNSIVADNNSATGPDVLLLPGLIETVGHNLIGKNDGAESAFPSGSPNTHSDLVGTSPTPLLALIGALANNGGATQTHLPSPGSPVVDSGTNTYVPEDDEFDVDGDGNSSEPFPGDQRGQSRITNNTVDIGAIEVSYSITTTSGSGQSALISSSFGDPLQATVTESGKTKSGISVTFSAPETGAGGIFNGNLTATVTTDSNGVATAPAFTANGIAGTYDVTASLHGGTLAATFSLTNTPGSAQVILGNLTQVYDGASKFAAATTVPAGLGVTLTYNGSATPPTNAGAYQVTATINDPNYSGQTFGTLYVARANQTINFGPLSNQTVGDAPFALSATATSGLPVSFNMVSGPASLAGNILTITGPGTVVVRAAQTGDANNNPAASVDRSFDVSKLQATIALGNLNQIYDGNAKNALATTNPPNLNILTVNYSQNGVVVAAPTNAGSYEVTAALSNDNYQASDASGTLVIAKASQSISFDDLPNRTFGDSDFAVSANASSGLAVSFTASGNCIIASNTLHLTGAGTCTVTASQDGNTNYLAAGAVSKSFSITKTTATITLENLIHTYDGTAQAVTVSTNPVGLNVTLTYDGSTNPPAGAGSYAVIGTINDPNYQGSVTNQLVINKATPALTWSNPSDLVYGIALSAAQLNATASVAGSFAYSPGAGAVLNAGSSQTLTVNFTPADAANYNAASKTVSLNVSKVNQTITFGSLPNRTYGDGPFTLSATSSTGLDVSFSVIDGPATISGNTVNLSGAGAVTIRASQSGDDNNNAATTVDRSFTVSKANQTITFAPLPNRTHGDGPFTLSATASSGLDVSFSVIDGPATISGNTVSLSGAGSVTIRASQSGDNNNNAAAAVDRTFTVAKANQTITFAPPVSRTYGDGPFTLSATASSGLDVSFSVIEGPATISGNTVSMTGAGSVTIRASQAGDSNNNAATAVDRTFTVTKASQTITFATLPDRTYGDGPFTLSATASSGLDVGFSVIDGPATISGKTVSLSGAGSVTIRASQPGDNNNNAATADRTFTVAKANQTITFASLPNRTYGDGPFTLSATASSGLDVSFSVIDGQATISGNTVSLSGAGSVTIRASQSGDNNNNAAAVVERTFTVSKANQTITFASLPNRTYGDGPFTLSVTASSALDVSFSVIDGPATISGNTVSLSGAGSVTIRAAQSGDSNNNAAAVVDRTFTVSKANQTITFALLPNRTYGDAPFTLGATASSGLDVSFTVIDGPATLSGNSVSLSGAGSVTIRASQPGDNNNNAATAVDRSFTVSKANQTITFASLPNRTYGDGPFTLSATSSSGLDVSFTVTDGPATISGNTVSLSGTGSVTIRASQTGDNNNNAAAVVERSFTVSTTDQTISFGIQNDKTFGDADFALSATASSNLTVTFAADGNCTVTGANVHLLGAGECKLTASQAGNEVYGPAPSVNQTFAIAKAPTTTVLASSINPAGFGQPVTLTATVASAAGSPTGTVQFKDNETNLGTPATVNPDGTATFAVPSLSAGAHTIRAEYSGDTNFIASDGLLPGGQAVGDNSPVIGFSASNYNVNESDGFIRIVLNRTGDAARAISVDYATGDAGAPADCSALNSGLAFARCDFNAMFGRLTFAPNETQKTFDLPINMDSYTEGPEVFTITLSNLTSGNLAPVSATVTINDSPSSNSNASDDTTMFVRQQYHDFLNREPDAAGLAFWKNNIDKCNDPAQREPGQTLAQCIEVQRVVTSAAFFLSIEFRQTGGLVRDFYVAALDRPATNNLPALVEFARDTQRIQQGIIVGEGNWQQTLNENRASFMNDFVMRAEFVGLYPTTDSPAQYVDKLYQHAGITPKTSQERNQTIAEFGVAPSADNASARAEALLRVTQNSSFQARELNRAFVQMEYFGYLRRNPSDAPDRDFAGYDFWVTKLNQFEGDFLKAEMVKAFVSSDEYRRRFGH